MRALLSSKEVFLIISQDQSTVQELEALGTAWRPVLQDFVQEGGVVIACSYARDEHLILNNGGLISLTKTGASRTATLVQPAADPLNQEVKTPFVGHYIAQYSTTNGQVALQTLSGSAVVISRDLGAGRAVMIGTDYSTNRTEMDQVIANVMRGVEGRSDQAVAVKPRVSGYFGNGVWSGTLGVQNVSPSVVLHADDGSDAFVFVDSDVRPSPKWLRHLVAPLQNDNVGAATGYRWFISDRPTFASEMRSAWNASIASALGPNTKTNFCWGGSMAIRRDVFERIDMREKWCGTLSDDFAVTRAMNEAGMDIVFVPQALTASVEDCTFREMLEFTTRQMKITRVYAPHLWLLSFVGSGLFILTMKGAFLIEMFRNKTDFAVLAALATISLVSIFSIGKSWLRLKAVKLVLTKYDTELNKQFWPQMTFWLLTPAIFFYNSFAALISRQMTWRGIKYELKSPTETVIITD